MVLFNTELRDSCRSLWDAPRVAETISIMADHSRTNLRNRIADPAIIEFRPASGSTLRLRARVAISKQRVQRIAEHNRILTARAEVYQIVADEELHRLILPYVLIEIFRNANPVDSVTNEHFSLSNWYLELF